MSCWLSASTWIRISLKRSIAAERSTRPVPHRRGKRQCEAGRAFAEGGEGRSSKRQQRGTCAGEGWHDHRFLSGVDRQRGKAFAIGYTQGRACSAPSDLHLRPGIQVQRREGRRQLHIAAGPNDPAGSFGLRSTRRPTASTALRAVESRQSRLAWLRAHDELGCAFTRRDGAEGDGGGVYRLSGPVGGSCRLAGGSGRDASNPHCCARISVRPARPSRLNRKAWSPAVNADLFRGLARERVMNDPDAV